MPKGPGVVARLEGLIKNADDIWSLSREITAIGNTALSAFLQANITGPPITWEVASVVPPNKLLHNVDDPTQDSRTQLIA